MLTSLFVCGTLNRGRCSVLPCGVLLLRAVSYAVVYCAVSAVSGGVLGCLVCCALLSCLERWSGAAICCVLHCVLPCNWGTDATVRHMPCVLLLSRPRRLRMLVGCGGWAPPLKHHLCNLCCDFHHSLQTTFEPGALSVPHTDMHTRCV